MKLVHLVSDPLAESLSVNKRVAAKFIERLRRESPDLSIEALDLERDPPPFYDRELFRYVWEPVADPAYRPSASETAAAGYMRRHAAILRDADLLLLSAPVWNYYLPAVLKAWIDQVLSPGEMFEFGADGRIPLHRIRAMVSVVSAGGLISNEGYARSLFHLLEATFRYAGIEDHHDLLIEGQEPALYPDHAQREAEAVAAAEGLAERLAERLAVDLARQPAARDRA